MNQSAVIAGIKKNILQADLGNVNVWFYGKLNQPEITKISPEVNFKLHNFLRNN